MRFRPRRIRASQELERLDALLRERRWLNVNWLFSIRKIFPIACADEVWLYPAATPRRGPGAIDVSRPSESLDWELAECARLGVTNRVIAVADQSSTPASGLLGAVPLLRYRAHRRLDDP